jgi:hypothetical protein
VNQLRRARKIDARSLQEEANKSEDKEAFAVLTRIRDFRVGVGARLESPSKPIFFIEIIASLCADRSVVNLNSLENKLLILRKLNERGYVLTCEEDEAISCELAAPSENLTLEYEAAILIINKYLD